ncbi:fibronectin type III domain-containing protein [Roseburia sp. BX1005]|uniref:Fibronectin type III domain-containing protein n=1 Tax=Roseburia zhanii TaxID=2763064 RepID=A0A923RU82_9FIRM|nr:fibronectin type III domain-containing protein [Roseburia zhanii]MBC5712959.1 fibronectin type III domain-containing protein [Roseburia zhanii]
MGVYDPFENGAVRMTENEGILYIHTSRLLYWDQSKDPGMVKHHQANLTYAVDEESMECVMNAAGGDWVSHSLDQYILTDGDYIYRLDLGDGAPRAVVVARNSVYKQPEDEHTWWMSNDRVFLMQMIGGYGQAYTGVSLGGFELMGDTLLVIGNSVVQDAAVTNANDETTHRNIFVITQDTNWETAPQFKFLTNYTKEDGITVRTPHIVKVADGYYILWEELYTERGSEVYTTRIAKMTPDGTIEGKIHRIKARLSDCKPIVTSDNRLLWYVTANNKSLLFYSLDLNRLDDYEYSGPVYAEDFDIRLSQYTFKCINSNHMQPYTPKVSVYYNGKKLVYGEDYTFDFRDYYTEGTAYVDVTGKDYFMGTQTVSYTILPADEEPPYREPSWWGSSSSQNKSQTGSTSNKNKTGNSSSSNKNSSTQAVQKPTKVTRVKVSNLWGRKIKVSWSRQQKISGYQIQYAQNKKFTKSKKTVNVSRGSSLKIIRGLKKKKTYYVRVRAYAASGNSKLYSAWSKSVKIKIKK